MKLYSCICLCCEICWVCSFEKRAESSEQAKRANRGDAPKPRSLFARGPAEPRMYDRGPVMSGSVLALFVSLYCRVLLITTNLLIYLLQTAVTVLFYVY